MGRLFACGLIAMFFLCGVSRAEGELNAEQLLSLGSGTSREPDVYIGPGDNVLMSLVENDQVYVTLGGGSVIATPMPSQSNPVAHLSLTGVVTVVYEQDDDTPGAVGPEIHYTQAQVSGFEPPLSLSSSIDSDIRPVVTGGISTDSLHVVWVRDSTGDILLSENLGAPAVVAQGGEVDLHTRPTGERHLLYIRDGDVFYRFAPSGSGFGAELAVAAGLAASQPNLTADAAGNLYIVFLAGGDVYYVNGLETGTFDAPLNTTASAAIEDEPRVLIGATGLKILFLRDNYIWEIQGAGPILLQPANRTLTPSEPEIDPEYAVDGLGHLHVVYVRDGECFYRNAVPPPVATFEWDPQSAETPVEVQFTDTSGGVVEQWFWTFGDGTSSNEQNPTHTYFGTGTYDVSLTVTGPGGQATLSVPNAVQVISPQNFMRVQPVQAFQNQSEVHIPILGTFIDPIQAFQISLEWDCGTLDVETITIEYSLTLAIAPEFVVAQVDPAECFAIFGCVFDVVQPFDGRTLDPAEDRRIANLVADIPGSAPVGVHEVRLINGLSEPPIFNIYTVDGVSVLPTLVAGEVEIIPFTFPLPPLFLRGDVDANGVNEITDAINLLGFLFSGGATPSCMDAADANDTGIVDVSDVVYILNFLFAGGAIVPPPYPNLGLDPTPDTLPGC
ncbi:MAG: PKD domain-containing protein [Planctomycetota bacterium]